MRPLNWLATTLGTVRKFPDDVRSEIGFSLYLAQEGDKAINARPLVGFGSAKVLEVIVDDSGDTYRAVYTVRFKSAVYVLHAFQKKSKRGKRTPQQDMNLIRRRLKIAEKHYIENYERDRQKRTKRN